MKLLHRLEGELGGDHDQSQQEPEAEQVQQIEEKSHPGQEETGWRRRLNALSDFWTKVNNDWVFNLSAMLAYNFLTSVFPILLFLIAVGGFVLAVVSPGARAQLETAITGFFPAGLGQTLVSGALHSLERSAGIAVAITLITALWSGSQLFVNISSTFNIIFRLRPRDTFHKYRMAISMMLLYTVLVPFVFLASSLSSALVALLFGSGGAGLKGFMVQVAALAVALVVGLALFGAIYVVVPNKPVRWREVWKGTLVAACLLVVYELLFPLYQNYLLKPGNYGSLAGFAIVILAFFYYLGFILLLGAEVNSWALGQRATASDIAGIVHQVQAYNTTRGAAGPTAGIPEEDLQGHKGRAAMESNTAAIYHERVQERRKGNQRPPTFSEATTSTPRKTAEAAEHTTGYNKNRPQHQPSPGQNEAAEVQGAASDGQGSSGRRSSSQPRQPSDHGAHDERHEGSHAQSQRPAPRHIEERVAMSDQHEYEPAGTAEVSEPARPEYAHPVPPEARDLPRQKHKRSSSVIIAAIVTAALPVVMWLFGRQRRPA